MSDQKPILILDLGSHSAKAYIHDTEVREVGSVSWTLLEDPDHLNSIEPAILALISPHQGSFSQIHAIGTEAFRRSGALENQVKSVCQGLKIRYQTLSQAEEAHLIQKAFASEAQSKNLDIVNAGGGSIQIITDEKIHLLNFGISDLNKKFFLNKSLLDRNHTECVEWTQAQLPQLRGFIYTGGEKAYLEKLQINLSNGACLASDFRRLATELTKCELDYLEQFSPFSPKWMHGAVASNCIVLACLNQSKADSFVPSNLNIAHGLVQQLSK